MRHGGSLGMRLAHRPSPSLRRARTATPSGDFLLDLELSYHTSRPIKLRITTMIETRINALNVLGYQLAHMRILRGVSTRNARAGLMLPTR
jgi:hypothetical protein